MESDDTIPELYVFLFFLRKENIGEGDSIGWITLYGIRYLSYTCVSFFSKERKFGIQEKRIVLDG